MNNSFSSFVDTYYNDIIAFFQALIAFVQSLFGKLNSGDADETTGE